MHKLYISHGIKDKADAKKLKVTTGSIKFDRVHFSYRDSEPLFENKSVIIPGGQKVGLVGHSGGGKTTFVNLIMRLYDIGSGSIKIDDQDLRHVTQDSLHAQLGVIPQ